MKSQRRQVGARFVARARGAFGFGGAKGTRNGATLGLITRRGPNVAQRGPNVTEKVDAECAQTVVQVAGVPDALRWGDVLPKTHTADTAAAG